MPKVTAPPVREGDVVAGKYRIGRVLGAGGMGVVVLGIQVELDRRVALKFLLRDNASSPEVAERFAREARACAKLESEHVTRVLDVGALEDGTPFIVMEHLEGEDLQRLLERRGRLPIAEAVDHVLAACVALAEAHSLDIVHRDIKPANLFLARRADGRSLIKVLDFGIAKAAPAASDARLTSTCAVFGSPLYMSPEQMSSSTAVGAASDIWSLGVTLYELLTGEPPFRGESRGALVASVLGKRPLAPSALCSEIPRELDAVVLRCLEKQSEARFRDVAGLALALAPFASNASVEFAARAAHVLGLAPGEPSAPPQVRASGVPTGMAASWTNPQAPAVATSPRARALRPALAGGAALSTAVALAAWAGGNWILDPVPHAAVAASRDSPPEVRAPASPASITSAASVEPSDPLTGSAVGTTGAAAAARAAKRATPPRQAPPVVAPECTRLLERLSLGESLSQAESAAFARRCRARGAQP